MAKIIGVVTKADLNLKPTIAESNKIVASDINKIVSVVNTNDDLKTDKGGYDGTSKDLKDAIDNAVFDGAITYQTVADLPIAPVPSEGTPAKVANDSTATNNGNWSVSGGVWVQDARTITDTEDINVEGSGLLFADRDKTVDSLGYKIIRSDFDFTNIPSGYDNSIWEIRHFHDLLTNTITLPSNVTLNFNGGKFGNGTIVGDNTKIVASDDFIFDTCTFSGTWNKQQLNPKWFGVQANGVDNDTPYFNSLLSFINNLDYRTEIKLGAGAYRLDSLTISNLRNVIFIGDGGIAVNPATTITFIGSGVDFNSSGDKCHLLIKSCYNVVFKDICLISGVSLAGANDRSVVVSANDSPALSSHFIYFDSSQITAISGVSFAKAPILVYASKLVKFERSLITYPINDDCLQIGIDDIETPNTLLKGSVENIAFEQCFIFNDVILQNVRGIIFDKATQFDILPNATGSSSIYSQGDEKAVDVDIFATFVGVDNRKPAIKQALRVASTQLTSSGGWRVKALIRDRIVGVEVTTGYINLDGTVFQSRNYNTSTPIGIDINEGAKNVVIGTSTDFSVLQNNNNIAIQDNRSINHQIVLTSVTGTFTVGETITGSTSGVTSTVISYDSAITTAIITTPLSDFTVTETITGATSGALGAFVRGTERVVRDSLIISNELTQDYTIPISSAFTSIINTKSEKQLIGGAYNVNLSVNIRSNVSSRYRCRVLVDGLDVGMAKSLYIPISEENDISMNKIIILPAGISSSSLFSIQIQQETIGSLAVIRGDTSLGDTWIQVTKM